MSDYLNAGRIANCEISIFRFSDLRDKDDCCLVGLEQTPNRLPLTIPGCSKLPSSATRVFGFN